jgi:hypothetical protein
MLFRRQDGSDVPPMGVVHERLWRLAAFFARVATGDGRGDGRNPLGAASGRSYSAWNEVAHMEKSAIKAGDERHACELAVPPILKIVTANGGAEWINPASQASIELIVAKTLDIPIGDYLLRLSGREMLFRVTMQKMHHVWGDAVSSSSQYSA